MLKPDPKISIIIPSFNQGQFIEETILSIIHQSYKNFEIIIIDGGSTDNAVEIIKKHESHLSYWISEKDKGQSNAINKGLKAATGEIVTWLNSDDYYEPGALEKIVKLFQKHPNAGIIHGKARLFGDKINDKIIGLEKDIPLCEYLPFMRFPQPSSFYKRAYLNSDFPVNEDLHYAMDFELVVKSILTGAKIIRTDALLSHYRLHPGSKSNNELLFLEEWTKVVYRFFCSVDKGKVFAEKLMTLNLLHRSPQNQEAHFLIDEQITFTNNELEMVFLEHLHLHYHINYRLYHTAACNFLSTYLKENYNGYYRKNRYNKYNFRLKFIPRIIFDLIRNPRK